MYVQTFSKFLFYLRTAITTASNKSNLVGKKTNPLQVQQQCKIFCSDHLSGQNSICGDLVNVREQMFAFAPEITLQKGGQWCIPYP